MRTKLNISRNLDLKLVNEMAKMGLLAKEQLALTPWFPDRSVLLCRYSVSRDARKGQASASGAEDGERGKEKIQRPPKAASMQVPSFIPKAPEQEEDMPMKQASAKPRTDNKERKKEANRPQKVNRPPSAVSMPVPSFGSRAREDKELSASMSRFQPPEAPLIQMMQDAGQDLQAKGKEKQTNRADYAPLAWATHRQHSQINLGWLQRRCSCSSECRPDMHKRSTRSKCSKRSKVAHRGFHAGLGHLDYRAYMDFQIRRLRQLLPHNRPNGKHRHRRFL